MMMSASSELYGFVMRELFVIQSRIQAILFQQLVMRTALHDLAMINHQDHVRRQDSRKTVSNSQRGAILHQWLQRRLDQAFRMCIQRAGSLIQDEYPRIL